MMSRRQFSASTLALVGTTALVQARRLMRVHLCVVVLVLTVAAPWAEAQDAAAIARIDAFVSQQLAEAGIPGGLTASANDMARYAQMLLAGGQAR